jgi:GTP cyclohydrolase FolE2
MRIRQSLIACGAALVVSISVSYAGPCSQEIARFRAAIAAEQLSNATTGLSAPESTAATTHRQPTQRPIGAAESQLGEVSPEKLHAVVAAVERASEADRAGDQIVIQHYCSQ